MIRVVLAVVAATALLTASLPAVKEARADRTASQMDRVGTRLGDASESLLAADDADAGARRVLTLTLPARSLTRAGVDRFAFGCTPDCVLEYRLSGGRTSHRVLGSDSLATPDGAIAFSRPGEHRLMLRVVRIDGRRVVTVRG